MDAQTAKLASAILALEAVKGPEQPEDPGIKDPTPDTGYADHFHYDGCNGAYVRNDAA